MSRGPDRWSLLAAAERERSTNCGGQSHGESLVDCGPASTVRLEAYREPGQFSWGVMGGVGITRGPAPSKNLERPEPPDLFLRALCTRVCGGRVA